MPAINLENIKRQFDQDFSYRERETGFTEITSPFLDMGGSNLRVFIKPLSEGRFVVTDLGEEFMTLDIAGVNYETHIKQNYITSEQKIFGVSEHQGQFYIRVESEEQIPEAVQNLFLFLGRIDALSLESRERTPQFFKESVADFLMKVAETRPSFSNFQENSSIHGAKKEYKVDFLLPNLLIPTIIETVAAPSRSVVERKSQVLVSEFVDIKEKHGKEYRKVVVFDDETEVVNEERDFAVLGLVADIVVPFSNEEQFLGALG